MAENILENIEDLWDELFRLKEALANDKIPNDALPLTLENLNIILDKIVLIKTGPQGPKGEPGKFPQKGTDYFTPQEQKDFLKKATPIRGTDYFTSKEILKFKKETTPRKGIDYSDGIDGIDGLDGKKGKDGKDAKEFSVGDFVKSLTKLEGDDKISANVLRDLIPIIIREAKKVVSVSKGGGGGDTMRFEAFTGDGSTKTFTTTYNIGGSVDETLLIGSDTPIPYMPTTDYTILGKTITLTSEVLAPSDGATIRFLYKDTT